MNYKYITVIIIVLVVDMRYIFFLLLSLSSWYKRYLSLLEELPLCVFSVYFVRHCNFWWYTGVKIVKCFEPIFFLVKWCCKEIFHYCYYVCVHLICIHKNGPYRFIERLLKQEVMSWVFNSNRVGSFHRMAGREF